MACPKCGECDLTFTFNFKCKSCEHSWHIDDSESVQKTSKENEK